MGNMKTSLRASAVAVSIAVLASQIPSVAAAAEDPSGMAALHAAERASGQNETTSEAGSADVTVPARADQAVQVHGASASASIGIRPELSGSLDSITDSTTTLVRDSARSVVIQSGPHSVSLMSVLADASSPTSTTFDLALPAHDTLLLDPLGGVIVENNGRAVGRFNAPWAVDADGRALPTSYTVTGNTITQTVDTTGAVFPVVADPHYTWGWVTGTVYFNVSETEKMAASATFVAALGAFLPPPFDLIVVASSGYIALRAAWALADHKCIAIRSNSNIFEYSGSQGDGYCR